MTLEDELEPGDSDDGFTTRALEGPIPFAKTALAATNTVVAAAYGAKYLQESGLQKGATTLLLGGTAAAGLLYSAGDSVDECYE